MATGLSALYSDLPQRLPNINDEWLGLSKNEWSANASMVQFMNSLQFCNDVIQVDQKSTIWIDSNKQNILSDRSSKHSSSSATIHLSWISCFCSWSEYLSGKMNDDEKERRWREYSHFSIVTVSSA